MRMTVQRLDWLLIMPLIAAALMITERVEVEPGEITLSPLVQGAVLAGGAVTVALALAALTSVERRCSEDYLVQLSASAGLIAVGTTALINMFWGIGQMTTPLPDLSGESMAGVTIFAWILSYYWYRLKGLNS